MQDLEIRLKALGETASRQAPCELRPTPRALRRIRVGRAVRSGAVLAAVAALVIGGFNAARSLTSDEALPPAQKQSNVEPFADTWTSTDRDGSTQTMTIRAAGDRAYEITVDDDLIGVSFFRPNRNGNYVRVVKDVCSGSPGTITGTGRLDSIGRLVVRSPVIRCNDGREPLWKVADDLAPLNEQYSHLTFEHDPESDILTSTSEASELTLVWTRAEPENPIGEISGWITYGDKRGIWARELTSSGDRAGTVRLDSTPGTPLAWSADGSKLLVVRDDDGLFVVNKDGTETRLTHANISINGASFSPDGAAVVYAAVSADDSSAIYLVDADGGPPELLLDPGSRRYPNPDEPGAYKQSDDGDDLFETLVQEPKWSPDGSQIAYFDGMGDWGNSLRVMNSDGTGVRVVVENSMTLGAGHVYGLDWAPDGEHLAFATTDGTFTAGEGWLDDDRGVYVVSVDASGLRRVVTDGLHPYWSPDGSHIAYTRPDPETYESGSLEIVRLDDLRIQNFGGGRSGPWIRDI